MQKLEILRSVLSKQFDIESSRVTPEAKLKEELDLDSLDLLNLLIFLEDEIKAASPESGSIAFDPDKAAEAQTVSDLLGLV